MNDEPPDRNPGDAPLLSLQIQMRQLGKNLKDISEGPRADMTLHFLQFAGGAILDAHEKSPSERNLALVRAAHDYLVELQDDRARKCWMDEIDRLQEPLSTVPELLDMAREMLDEPQGDPEKSQS